VRGTVEGAGVPLAYEERGAGAPVLLVHGLATTAAPLLAEVDADARLVAYDRRGYGASGAPEPYLGTTVEEQGEDAAALLRALGMDGAVVVGDGFGGLVALDLAARHRPLVSALVLREPPFFAFVPEATEVLAAAQGRVREAVHTGGPAAGVEAWTGTRPAPEAVRGFYADVAGLASLALGRRDLRALDLPVVLVTGPGTPPHVRRAADVLAGLLPSARPAGELGEALASVLQ
jgi:pimeloyl-ACP methyl ester carboxylesterase